MASTPTNIKLRTTPPYIRALRNGVFLLAAAFMVAMASVSQATALVGHFPLMSTVLFALPALLVTHAFLSGVFTHHHETPYGGDVGLPQLLVVIMLLLCVTIGFSALSRSSVGKTIAPGWGHANRMTGLRHASEQIKQGGGSLDDPFNLLISQALVSHEYRIVLLAHEHYEEKQFHGEAFTRWMMAHHLYRIYPDMSLKRFQSAGWVDKARAQEVRALALENPPLPGATLIQQQAWAVLAGEADPMTSMGTVLKADK